MEIQKIKDGLAALIASAGSKAHASFAIESDDMHVYFRPKGFGVGEPSMFGRGETPEACVEDARRQWAKISDSVREETIKKLALAIIRITHEQGNCTDAALRASFEAFEVQQYSAEAVTLANTMAENGPFEVLELRSANAA